MRMIKFRGKRINRNGEWAYGDLRQLPDRTLILPQGSYDAAIDRDAVDETTIGQFTGLLDKNGKEIYEGDIVKVNDDYTCYGFMAGEIRMVWFNMGGYKLKPKYQSSISRGDRGFWIECGNDFEVIGNIHDNPELLKE